MELIELASALIACPSITPNDAGCQEIIKTQLSSLGFKCETMRFGEVDNLYARLGTASPLLVFAGHTDVVPTGDFAEWQSPPFAPEIRDDHLHGRGATDMKSALAAMMIATRNFLSKHSEFKGSLAFLITSDEEGDAINGTQKVIEVLKTRDEKIDYCLIGEASSEKRVGDQLRVGRRGSLHGTLIIHGKQGHVAHPHLAENPIHYAGSVIESLTQTVWDQGNEFFPATSFQITNVHAGTGATNVIPSTIEIKFNFRFGTASTVDELQNKVITILEQHHFTYDLSWKIGGLPFLSQQGKLLQATVAAVNELTGKAPALSTGGGTSDGRFIAPTGAEVIELGVIHATAHHVNECVNIHELHKLCEMYEKILDNLHS